MTNWQQRASEFAEKHNLIRSPGVYALDLLSELGEVAKEILLATDYGKRPLPTQFNQSDLAGELGDALYSLCLLAHASGIDLEAAFATTLTKYEQRRQQQGNPGSK